MSEQTAFHCPQCGEPTERLYEGYCEPCCEANQQALDRHNAQRDAWQKASTVIRDQAIREALRHG